jgi:hypothetical protein
VWRVLACRASLPSSENNLSINIFSIVSQTPVMTSLNFNPMCLRAPKAVTDRIRQQFSGFPRNQWQDQVLRGTVLE